MDAVRRTRTEALAVCVALVLLTACGSGADRSRTESADDTTATPSPADSSRSTAGSTPSPTERPNPPAGTRVIVHDSDFGPMLYAADGQAIYLFDLEDTVRPRCYDDCADAWPPVLTEGRPVADRGTRQNLLGTVRRDDGSTQVTYGGHPLYFYAHEEPWQVLCHDFFEYGGTWFVVRPDGRAAA